jgi:hypothetical protein
MLYLVSLSLIANVRNSMSRIECEILIKRNFCNVLAWMKMNLIYKLVAYTNIKMLDFG